VKRGNRRIKKKAQKCQAEECGKKKQKKNGEPEQSEETKQKRERARGRQEPNLHNESALSVGDQRGDRRGNPGLGGGDQQAALECHLLLVVQRLAEQSAESHLREEEW